MEIDDASQGRAVGPHTGFPLGCRAGIGDHDFSDGARCDAVGGKIVIRPGRAGPGVEGCKSLDVRSAIPVAQENEVELRPFVGEMLELGVVIDLNVHDDKVRAASLGLVKNYSPIEAGTDRPHAAGVRRVDRKVADRDLHHRASRHVVGRTAQILDLPDTFGESGPALKALKIVRARHRRGADNQRAKRDRQNKPSKTYESTCCEHGRTPANKRRFASLIGSFARARVDADSTGAKLARLRGLLRLR